MVRNSANTNPHRRAKKVQMSAAPFGVHQSAPCPAPAAEPVGIRDEGHTVTTEKDGRIFRWHGVEPYTRKDGESTMLLLWRGTCAACGAPFTVKTPQRLEGTKAFGRKHCDMHKLKGGRFLAVEVKAQAGRLRPEQALFLARIRCAGGVAFVARDCRDVLRTLGEAQAP